MAWQFDRPDLGEGIVQAFRRSESVAETSRYPLRGLEPDATYDLADFDQPDRTHMTGRQLIEEGLAITINDRPGAAVIRYRKVS